MENNKKPCVPITEMIKWWNNNGNFNIAHYALYISIKAAIK